MKLSSKLLRLHREYNKLHREEIVIKSRLFRIKNREKCSNYRKQYYKKHKDEEHNYRKEKRKWNLGSWNNFLPIKTKCQICGRIIYWKALDKLNTIHFDHRHEGKEPIKIFPRYWLRTHPNNPTNQAIWKKSDFGLLCHLCNYRLPTNNRKDWVAKMNKYVSSNGG